MSDEKKPGIKIAYSKLEKVLEVISLIGIALNVYIILRYYSVLPDTIPRHYGAAGVPDGYAGKSSLFFIPIVMLSLYILLTVLSRFPHTFNYAVEINEKNAKAQYHAARIMMIIMKAEIVCCFTYIESKTVMVALGKATGLGIGFLPVFLIIIFGTIGVYINKSLKINKKENIWRAVELQPLYLMQVEYFYI